MSFFLLACLNLNEVNKMSHDFVRVSNQRVKVMRKLNMVVQAAMLNNRLKVIATKTVLWEFKTGKKTLF